MRHPIFLLALPLILIGCSCESTPVGGCETEGDCTAGQACVDSRCVPRSDGGLPDSPAMDTPLGDTSTLDMASGCTTSAECTNGICLAAGMCVASGPECARDEDCGGDRYCCAEGCVADGEMAACISYGTGPRGEINEACTGAVPVGLFQPSVQCEWTGPPDGDAFPGHFQVLGTPLAADLAIGAAADPDSPTPGEIVFVSYNNSDGGGLAAEGTDPDYFGVIRVLNGQDCSQLETIDDPDHRLIGAVPPAIGDLDGDGIPEIVALVALRGVIAFKWNPETSRHETLWFAADSDVRGNRWDGPAIHDLNDDGRPEVLFRDEVFDGMTGARLNPGQTGITQGISTGSMPVAIDVDGDGAIELIANDIFRWDRDANMWVMAYTGPGAASHQHAAADFGSMVGGSFDPTALDGIAEIVSVSGAGLVQIHTLAGEVVLSGSIPGDPPGSGGPPTVGDFDNDGFPEVASAGATQYAVFDFDCAAASEECVGGFVRWSTTSQDRSSNRTGSSIFDFEGDGQAEAVYADECFTRIYEGRTGEVLYSAFRTSCTWYENPIVVDVDRDENTEIIVGSNSNCSVTCPLIDPIHPGERCEDGEDCLSGMCSGGLCRCENEMQCGDNNTCTSPLDGSEGNVCRAVHPAGATQAGIRVLRDSLDRWVSSRPIWNQHTYSITNVNDDGTIPRTSERRLNHREMGMNNYRQNAQGDREVGALPDITGRLDADICQAEEGMPTRLVSTVCNRGGRAVGAALPATFYLGDPADGNVLCTSFTEGAVPVGGCLEVSCELTMDINGSVVHVVVNDDGEGGATAFECNAENNGDSVMVDECVVII